MLLIIMVVDILFVAVVLDVTDVSNLEVGRKLHNVCLMFKKHIVGVISCNLGCKYSVIIIGSV